jgi:hypothetical protein
VCPGEYIVAGEQLSETFDERSYLTVPDQGEERWIGE